MDMNKATACCTPGTYDPNKTVEQATFERLRMIRMATGNPCSHFTDAERLQAEMDEHGGMQESQS